MSGTSRAGFARPLNDEIQRQHVIDRLESRWNAAVTLLTAPGGYGKTRALAQAVADNDVDPVGVDVYLRLRPAHADWHRLALDLAGLVDPEAEFSATSPENAADELIDRLAALAPSRVAVMIDDAHLIEVMSASDAGSNSPSGSEALLSGLIRRLTTNVGLVLCGRSAPKLPLARLRASDDVVEIQAADLAFRPDEISALNAAHGVADGDLGDLAGWPALVRLALVAGRSGSEEFLVQEVIEHLEPDVRHALGVAVLAGSAGPNIMTRCGSGGDVAGAPPARHQRSIVARLEEAVPLLDRLENGDLQPHDLWRSVIDLLLDADERQRLAAIIAPWHSDAGRHDEAITIAAENGLWGEAQRRIMAATSGTDTGLSPELTHRWEQFFPPSLSDEPALRFLRGRHRRLADGPGHGVDDIVAAIEGFHERGDVLGEAQATHERGYGAWLISDMAGLLDVLGRAPRLIEAGAAFMAPYVAAGEAAAAEMSGDVPLAHELASRPYPEGTPVEFEELRLRHLSMLTFLLGDSAEGAALTRRVAELRDAPRNRFFGAVGSFADGHIDALVGQWDELRYLEIGNPRDDFIHASYSCVVDATLGLSPQCHRVEDLKWDRAREEIFAACATLCAGLINGDPDAERLFSESLNRLDRDDHLVGLDLRRFLAHTYVADPEMRERFESDSIDPPLGPQHVMMRWLGRTLLSLRAGGQPDWRHYPGPHKTLTSLPLPWTVELACGLINHDEARALDLFDLLVEVTGARAHDWLRSVAYGRSRDAAALATGAKRLLALLPSPPAEVLRVRVQNELVIEREGEWTVPKRKRVRELLSLLVLRPSIERDEIMSLLWPDSDPDKARQNMATTLTYLRRELEPDRRVGEPSFHVRQRGTRLALHRSEYLDIDLWHLTGLAATASESDGEECAAALSGVARLWVGITLPDLRTKDELIGELVHLDGQFLDLTSQAVERWIAVGDHETAAKVAARLVRLDPHDERAHRGLIGAQLGLGNDRAAQRAIDACVSALGDLGVEPTAATRMLIRQSRVTQTETAA